MGYSWTSLGLFVLVSYTLPRLLSNFKPHKRKRRAEERLNTEELPLPLLGNAYLNSIGNTPLVLLPRLSALTQCAIYVKMESLNPGGTGKDRAAKYMVLAAVRSKEIHLSSQTRVVEGTSGSTGISLAAICKSLHLPLTIVMPDDQSLEKQKMLQTLGADLLIVPSCAISNPNHYVNRAKQLASSQNAFFVNQFENLANYQAHFESTGPEIYRQIREDYNHSQIDAFVMSSGTGGTIAGVSQYLKSKNPHTLVVLADPPGSSLFNKVKFGVCYASQQSERSIRRHRYDSIVEGVGLDRITSNFNKALIDDAISVSDQNMVNMAHWILRYEGLLIGSSSALNISAAYETAIKLGPGRTIVTVVCDTGQRHMSRFWNKEYLEQYGLHFPTQSQIESLLVPPSIK